MQRRARNRRGWTLVENAVAALALAGVATAVGSAVTFSASRTAFERQRAVVVSALRSDLSVIQAAGRLGTAPVGTVQTARALTGVPAGWTFERTVTADGQEVGRFHVDLVGRWTTSRENVVRLRSAVWVSALTRVAIDSRGTFGRSTVGAAQSPAMVDLASRGIVAGDRVRISRFGSYGPWGANGTFVFGVVGAFSSNPTVLANQRVVERLPGIIPVANGPAFLTNDVFVIQQDHPTGTFQIASNVAGVRESVTVVVPRGSRYLFLGPADRLNFADNVTHPSGFGVRIEKLSGSGGSGGAQTTIVADSLRDWGPQGHRGWTYGFYDSADPGTVDVRRYRLLQGYQHAALNSDGYTIDGRDVNGDANHPASAWWVSQGRTWMHPGGGGSRRAGERFVVARRWTASTEVAQARARGILQRASNQGDGVEFRLVGSDGTTLWQDSLVRVPVGFQRGFNVSLGTLQPGQWVEVRVGAMGTDSFDTTNVTFWVEGVQ